LIAHGCILPMTTQSHDEAAVHMQTAPQLVWTAHNKPSVAACVKGYGRCLVCCGEVNRGQPVGEWLKSSFTDQNRTRNPLATHVCEACCYVMSRTSPVLGRPPKPCNVCDGTLRIVRKPPKGKGSRSSIGDACPKCNGTGMGEHGGNFRCYSHMIETGWDSPAFGQDGCGWSRGYINASKGEKPLIREFLRREHASLWCCGIADSGKKHVLPFTPINAPSRGGVVLFEEQLVVVPDSLELVDAMAELLTAGATKDELDRGDYRAHTWIRCEAEVRAFEGAHGGERHSAWWALALWLAQRDEDTVAARLEAEKEAKKAAKPRKARRNSDQRSDERAAQKPDGGGAASDAKRIPGDGTGKPNEELGNTTEPSSVRGKKRIKRRGVADEATKRPTNPEHETLRLPGID
jgi:hypothetical protein